MQHDTLLAEEGPDREPFAAAHEILLKCFDEVVQIWLVVAILDVQKGIKERLPKLI